MEPDGTRLCRSKCDGNTEKFCRSEDGPVCRMLPNEIRELLVANQYTIIEQIG